MGHSVYDFLVAGGGFRGICAAYLLAEKGATVALAERTSAIGGVMRPVPWQGFLLDRGCHLFGNDRDDCTNVLLGILGDNWAPVQVRYASVNRGDVTTGYSIPDLSVLPASTRDRILREMIEVAVHRPAQMLQTLAELLTVRLGETATDILDRMARKIYRVPLADISAEVLRTTPFSRVPVQGRRSSHVAQESS